MADTVLPPLDVKRVSDRGPAATVAAPAVADNAGMDYLAVYRQFCAEEGCKANSAFVRYIQDRGGHFSLERLNLGNNYLGSKGLRPVLRMIDLCQTIVSINLEGNGIGNEAVIDLCEVLQRHVSISSLNLSQNPISVGGGKRLLQLVESKPRITEVLLGGTDIFDGLQGRIRMALQHNAAVQDGGCPHMEVNKDPSLLAAAAALKAGGKPNTRDGRSPTPPPRRRVGAATLPAAPAQKATLQPVHHRPHSAATGMADSVASAPGSRFGTGAAAGGAAGAVGGSAARRGPSTRPLSPRSNYSHSPAPSAGGMSEASSRYTWQEASLGKPQPRPPLPAVASQESKALSTSKVRDLKTLFAERARLHTEVNRGEASRRAYAARQELLALEHHGRPVDAAPPRTYPVAGSVALPLLDSPSDLVEAAGSPLAHTQNAASTTLPDAAVTTAVAAEAVPDDAHVGAPSAHSAEAGNAPTPSLLRPGSVRGASLLSSPSLAAGAAAGRGGEAPPSALVAMSATGEAGGAAAAEGAVPAERLEAHTIEDVLSPARMMLLTTEEQFTVLFDQGCREYMNRNLDAAYMAWNEAMRVAVSEGQREWMAVVASNLQRLSYELLVEEGAAYLEKGELVKARDTFKLAHDVAAKAKNAAWERDMRNAQQNVQKALFHRCHEAALLLFRRAQEDMSDGVAATVVTEDDYFVLPGTDEMVRHTAAFVREWSCLLVLKEAVGLWAEASRVVTCLSDGAAAPLKENLKDALTLVAAFIAEHHFNATPPPGLTWFGTDAFLYHECVLLSELWYDLVAMSEQNLRHSLLAAMCSAQLGELYVATFQLPQALVQLNKMVAYGHANRSPLLEATGLTLCGRVHLQRADYALAEAALDDAQRLWAELRGGDVADSRTAADTRTPASASSRYDVALMDPLAAVATEEAAADGAGGAAPAAMGAAGSTGGSEGRVLSGSSVRGAEGMDAMASTMGHGASARFRIETHLPTDAIAVLANACQHYRVCLLLRTYRYGTALEALESGLNEAYGDTLQEKLARNFRLNPSLDEIAAIAGVLKTPLVFYMLMAKYDWSVKDNAYATEEALCMWVVAESREMRFVEVNLTKDFKVSLWDLITSLRQRLCVEPEPAVQPSIITELPSRSWQEPLRVLYQACIHPILGYVRALDPQLLFGDGMLTVVPSGPLWLVPFHALLNVKAGDRYLVEEAAVQMAFSATQAAFAALCAQRVQQQDLHREVVAVQREAEAGAADPELHTAYPFNTDRAGQEAAAVAAMLSSGQEKLAERLRRRAGPEAAVFTRKVELAEDVESLRAVLPRARAVHIAAATTTAPPPSLVEHASRTAPRPEDEGALILCTASPMGDVGVMRAAEIAHMELAAEHVVLTDTNVSPAHMNGTRDDTLGLVRGFFGGGVPCVIAGQWCTPDMKPIELFRYFYAQWCRPTVPAVSDESVNTGTARCGSASTSTMQSSRIAGRQHWATDDDDEMEEEGDVVRHRALLLARSVRQLLADEPAMRYRPRVWAGYYCIGTGW